MNHQEIIDKFYNRISWANECQEETFEDRLICYCSDFVYLPAFYGDYLKDSEIIVRASKVFNREPAMLLYGDAERSMVEKIWWWSHKHDPMIDVGWHDITREIWKNRLTTQFLDGINWQESFKYGRAIYIN